MGGKDVRKNDIKEFKYKNNGIKKYIWMLGGISMDIVATVGIYVLINNIGRIVNAIYFYGILFVLLVIIVLGSELIGVYFGSFDQYIYDKNKKKVLDVNE